MPRVLTMPENPFEVGSYTVRDAALMLRVSTPPKRLDAFRAWQMAGRPYVASSRAIYTWIRNTKEFEDPEPISSRDRIIGFSDLIRLRMYAVMLGQGLRLAKIVEAENWARRNFGLEQPFVTEPLWTSHSDIFIEWAHQFIMATRAGQMALPILTDYLEPASHGLIFVDEVASSWEPHTGIVLDPGVEFGASCVAGTRVATEVIDAFRRAGDSPEVIARAYGLEVGGVEAALAWEARLAEAAV